MTSKVRAARDEVLRSDRRARRLAQAAAHRAGEVRVDAVDDGARDETPQPERAETEHARHLAAAGARVTAAALDATAALFLHSVAGRAPDAARRGSGGRRRGDPQPPHAPAAYGRMPRPPPARVARGPTMK